MANQDIDLLEYGASSPTTVQVLGFGRQAAAASKSVVWGTEDQTVMTALQTALQLIDDVVATIGSASPSKGNMIAGHDGTNAQRIKTDSSGELQVDVLTLPNLPTLAGVAPAFGAGANGATVLRVAQATDGPGVYTSAAHGASDAGDPMKVGGYASSAAPSNVANGQRVNSWWQLNGSLSVQLVAGSAILTGDATNGLDVDVTRLGGQSPAYGSGVNGSNVLRVALATDSPGVMASASHGATDAGDPLKIGGYAKAAAPSNVTDGQRVNAWYQLNGAGVQRLVGSAGALIDGDASNGLDVDVTRMASLVAGTAMIGHVGGTEYETVAASQTDQSLGATGASGDYLAAVLIIPATTSPGAVSIKDGAGSAITIFTGGASSVSNLVPFAVPVGAKSNSGAWKVTTGSNVSAIGFGDFT